jgi:DNA-directed RNA polymerase subunit RPC12/RpoP
MCLIVVKESGVKLPNKEHLENGSFSNRDGIGIALHKKNIGGVLIKKDFANVFLLNKWIEENVKEEDSLIVHFRTATSGLKDAGNAHPFPIVKDDKLLRTTELIWENAVAHNGIFRDYGNNAVLNDTQEFIQEVLSEDIVKNNLKNLIIQKLIKESIGSSKLAFMLEDGEIITLGEYQEEKGVKFSNCCYRWSKYNTRIGFNNSYRSGDLYNKDWCEGCESMKEDVKEIWHKKVKFTICRECRKKLALGQLENLYNIKKSKKDEKDVVFCSTCMTFIDRIYANYVSRDLLLNKTIWICDECKKKQKENNEENKVTCPFCDNKVYKKDMVFYQGIDEKICIDCIRELTIGGAGRENGNNTKLLENNSK